MSISDLFDVALKYSERKQGILDLIEKIKVANDTDKEVCGHCDFWMKSFLCPKERNVNGRNKGPSMSGITCNKFKLVEWVKELKEKRNKEIKENPYFKEFTKPMKAQNESE